MSLTNQQLRYLRGLAHDLRPVILVGAKGLTEAVIAELELALDHHELVKIRIAAEDRDSRDETVENLPARVNAEKVQRIGHTLTLYRAHPDDPQIELPR